MLAVRWALSWAPPRASAFGCMLSWPDVGVLRVSISREQVRKVWPFNDLGSEICVFLFYFMLIDKGNNKGLPKFTVKSPSKFPVWGCGGYPAPLGKSPALIGVLQFISVLTQSSIRLHRLRAQPHTPAFHFRCLMQVEVVTWSSD